MNLRYCFNNSLNLSYSFKNLNGLKYCQYFSHINTAKRSAYIVKADLFYINLKLGVQLLIFKS